MMMDGSTNNNFNAENNLNATQEVKQPTVTQYVDQLGNPIDSSLIDTNGNYITNSPTQYVDEFGNPIDPSLIDQNGNYIGNNTLQYVDELGNPIDPSLIDQNGNYIGNNTLQYIDEFGNPIDPSLIDENGNYIGNVENSLPASIDGETLAQQLNNASGNIVEPTQNVDMSAAVSNKKELLSGMVTFDYNNVPITDIVNSIILDSINKGASDIHFDPFDEGIKIRLRIDGELNDYSIVPLYVKRNMITRIKIISGMNITESRTPQDGAIRTELQNKTIDLRVSCLPTNVGEKIVVRIMDYSMSAQGLEALDFSENNLEKVQRMLELPNGIILVTGATGSGKSTTVYSMLQKLNVEGTNLITVEDPIEMNIGGINQVQAQSEIGLTFAAVLRSILRQDPDVIMIGEIRDDETARIAVRASITGHLVLSTIHTNNALNTIERLTDMSVERYLLGSSLSGVISQKLARRLCDNCKRLRKTTDYEKSIIKTTLEKDVDEIYEPVGCPECSRGYRGRIAVHEVLLLNQPIRDAITKGVSKSELRTLVYSHHGTDTMLEDGLKKVLAGKTSFEEILKLIDLEDDLGTGTQLGLVNQIEASTYNNDDPNANLLKTPELSGPKPTAVINDITTPVAPVGPQLPAQQPAPINLNIPPELLASLSGLTSLKNIADELAKVASNETDEDENTETIIRKHKKKPKKIIIEEIIDDDDDEDFDDELDTLEDENSFYDIPDDKEVQDDDIGSQLFEEIDEIRDNIPDIEIPPTPPIVEDDVLDILDSEENYSSTSDEIKKDEVEDFDFTNDTKQEDLETLDETTEATIDNDTEAFEDYIEEQPSLIDDYDIEDEVTQDTIDILEDQPETIDNIEEIIIDEKPLEDNIEEVTPLIDQYEIEEDTHSDVIDYQPTVFDEEPNDIVDSSIDHDSILEDEPIIEQELAAEDNVQEKDIIDTSLPNEDVIEIIEENKDSDHEVENEASDDAENTPDDIIKEAEKEINDNIEVFDNEPIYIDLNNVEYLQSLIKSIPAKEVEFVDIRNKDIIPSNIQAKEIDSVNLANYSVPFDKNNFKEIDDDIEVSGNDFNLSNTEINNLLDVLEGE